MVSAYTIDFMKLSCFDIREVVFDVFTSLCFNDWRWYYLNVSLLDCKFCPLSICSISFLCICLRGE